ncbi:hypothetical protein HYC85_022710 [Camellia sinensis]|uniref:Uncharacterized protein n=1 Tax=Camellia sinensis TaxID=4442 RepID=A0A7J7GET4_CAMSI|nr:hypothetical protein HYC85_022710 [Camellia sinensis]
MGSLYVENIGNIDHEVQMKVGSAPKGNGSQGHSTHQTNLESERPSDSSASSEECQQNNFDATRNHQEYKKPNSPVIPDEPLPNISRTDEGSCYCCHRTDI